MNGDYFDLLVSLQVLYSRSKVILCIVSIFFFVLCWRDASFSGRSSLFLASASGSHCLLKIS